MKKSLLLLSLLALTSPMVAFAEEKVDDAKIQELTEQIEIKKKELDDLKAELKQLKGEDGAEGEEAVIVDDENFLIKYKNFEEKENDFGKYIEFHFEVENKTDQDAVFQSKNVSLNGTMIDDIVIMSQDVAAGKKSDLTMTLTDHYGEKELPEMTGEIEMSILILSWDDYNFNFEYPFVLQLD